METVNQNQYTAQQKFSQEPLCEIISMPGEIISMPG